MNILCRDILDLISKIRVPPVDIECSILTIIHTKDPASDDIYKELPVTYNTEITKLQKLRRHSFYNVLVPTVDFEEGFFDEGVGG